MSEELICHFGKHKGKRIDEMPSGYLMWCLNNIQAAVPPEHRFHKDGIAMTDEEVKQAESDMRDFLSAAEDKLNEWGKL
jgi:hypothetical protein